MKSIKKIVAVALVGVSIAALFAVSVFVVLPAAKAEKSLKSVCVALDAAMLRAEKAAKDEKHDLRFCKNFEKPLDKLSYY